MVKLAASPVESAAAETTCGETILSDCSPQKSNPLWNLREKTGATLEKKVRAAPQCHSSARLADPLLGCSPAEPNSVSPADALSQISNK